MALSDSDIEKLCHGRIIYGNLESSFGINDCGAHFAVMLDSDEEIKSQTSYYVAGISNNTTIDSTFVVPVPASTGLFGNIICSWTPILPEPGIIKVLEAKLTTVEMMKIEQMRRAYRRSKAAT